MKKFFIVITSIMCITSLFACSHPKANNQPSVIEPQLPAGAVTFDYQQHLYFDVILRDSISARMIFDTGNTHLLLDSTFYATTIGNKNLRKTMLQGAGGGIEMAHIDASGWDYRVGAKSQKGQMAVVMNLRKILGEGVDGMFGMKYMQGERVEFCYEKGYMRLLATDEVIGNDYIRVPCKWLDDNKMRILMPLSIILPDGYSYEGDFLVDMGMSGTLALNSNTARVLKQNKHLPNARRMAYMVGGVGGSRVDYVFKAQQVTIGGKAIKDVRAVWNENEQGAMADTRYAGIIGNDLLARFDVIYDFAGCAIYLRPNNKFNAQQANDLGIVLTPMSNYWIVNGLLEGGNAEQAGLRRGDRIETINDIRINDANANRLYPLPEKLTLSVQRENGTMEIVVYRE